MSNLHQGNATKEFGGSLTRAQNNIRSVNSMNMLKKQTYKPVSKKRLGTPIKFKSQTILDIDEEEDELIQNLTKEIEELRAKRMSHDLYKKNLVDDDDSDEFETAIFELEATFSMPDLKTLQFIVDMIYGNRYDKVILQCLKNRRTAEEAFSYGAIGDQVEALKAAYLAEEKKA